MQLIFEFILNEIYWVTRSLEWRQIEFTLDYLSGEDEEGYCYSPQAFLPLSGSGCYVLS